MKNWHYFLILCVFTQCRKAPMPLPAEVSRIPSEPLSGLKGFYLLNEGNFNMNKASLDYLDLVNGIYTRNLYAKENPSITRGLGDVGNDIQIYGSKMYITVNASNKVEVLNVKDGKKIGQIDLINCRYLMPYQGKMYVSAYFSRIGDPNAANGIVAEIDTTNLKITRTVEVGRQPEEMAIMDNELFVANSGGYSPENYENTLSVINLNSFKETQRIPVAINLHRVKADHEGDLYVTSRGDYYQIPSRLYVINSRTKTIKKVFDIAVSNLCITGDKAFIYANDFSYTQGNTSISYHIINVATETLQAESFITDGTEKNIKVPYGIAVNPETKDIYITDAKDYVSPGKLHCYSSFGKLKWSVTTGDIPAHIAFVH